MPDGPARNAFERAQASALALGISWWDALRDVLERKGPGATVSEPQYLSLGDPLSGFGRQSLERRSVTFPGKQDEEVRRWCITRTTPMRFSMLPPELLEGIARNLLAQSEAEWRQANLANLVEFARNFAHDDGIDIARMMLGEKASEAELQAYAASILPEGLLDGEVGAANFFDHSVSTVEIGEDEDGNPVLLPEPAPPPGVQPIDVGEWDFYTPEEVAGYGGAESDPAYAFRVVRLCEALRSDPERAVQIAMLLGAVTREWELWRENEEFLRVGRARFAEQSRHARSKPEKPWITQVRADIAADRIGPSIAAYARKLKQRRDLQPPSIERIRNVVSELRAQATGASR